jgi:hypothetical protein
MQAQRKAILDAAGAYGQVAAAVNDYRGRQTLMFERDQIGRTNMEASVYARARSQGYTEFESPGARAFMAQARENAEMFETKAMLTDGVTSFVTDLRRGGDAATALSNAFGNAADRLIAKVMDSAISSVFGAVGGNTGGGVGGFISSLFGGGSSGDSGVGLTSDGGWAGGGFTGHGGRYDVAGLVHRGEVVWSQTDVARVGGVAVAEAIRRGMPGYADGGYVGPQREAFTSPASVETRRAMASAANANEAPIIINTTGQPAQTQRVQGPRGPRDAIVIGKTIAGAIASDPDVRDALSKAWGLKRVGR